MRSSFFTADSCRSYVLRNGRMTLAQKRVLSRSNKHAILQPEQAPIDWNRVFGAVAGTEKIIEIGFGGGENLIAAAESRPQDCFIGIEVYPNGIGSLLLAMDKKELRNIRIIRADAKEAINLFFTPNTLDEIRVFFPDPWPKRRHHKRRLLQFDFLQSLVSRLRGSGLLHIVTDWEDYARTVLANLEDCPDCHNLYEEFAPSPANHRCMTKYEKRAQKNNSTIFELLFLKDLIIA